MNKIVHKSVRFSPAEMADDGSDEIDFCRTRFVGRGRAGMEMARRISQARGAEKRKLIESLPRFEDRGSGNADTNVRLEPDVATVFKNGAAVNKILRALIQTMPGIEPAKRRKIA